MIERIPCIDVSPLITILDNLKANARSKETLRVIDTLQTAIKAMPTINADPVINAQWAKRDVFGEDPWECSHCGDTVSVYGYQRCPSCGAHMDANTTFEARPDATEISCGEQEKKRCCQREDWIQKYQQCGNPEQTASESGEYAAPPDKECNL